jgi:hypothetical protein
MMNARINTNTIENQIDQIDYMAAKQKSGSKKTTSTTLQIVMKERQEFLLQQLANQKGVPKSAILIECARRVVEKYGYLLSDGDQDVSKTTHN